MFSNTVIKIKIKFAMPMGFSYGISAEISDVFSIQKCLNSISIVNN